MVAVLVTGATGFIGKNLVRKLCLRDYQVFGVSKKGGIVSDVSIDSIDCTDRETISGYCKSKSFDCVIHLAASIPASFWDDAAKQSIIHNVKMTMNILEICQELNSLLIYASSTSVYGYPEKLPVTEETPARPDGFYPIGKFSGELLCQQYQKRYNLPITILRISAPYGPGMRQETVIKKFIKQALLSESITLYGKGTRSQDFTYIEDVTDAIMQVCKVKATGVFNVSSGISTSMKQLAGIILSVLPKSKSEVVYTGMDDPQENYHAAFSFEKARKSFGYEPRFYLKEGIQKYTEAIREELGI